MFTSTGCVAFLASCLQTSVLHSGSSLPTMVKKQVFCTEVVIQVSEAALPHVLLARMKPKLQEPIILTGHAISADEERLYQEALAQIVPRKPAFVPGASNTPN